jgi:(p)ppGpp synthase/HD superfamily hydrolase
MSLSTRFEDAFQYAARAHAGQTKKGTRTPYIAHLMAVTALVIDDGGSEDEAIAALLHDVVEDHGGRPRLDDVRRRFGDRVAEIVEGCTDSFETPKPPWLERKRAYVEHTRRAGPSVVRVSAADKLVNVSTILRDLRRAGSDVWKRFAVGPTDVAWYYTEMTAALRAAGGGVLVDELAKATEELRALAGASGGEGGAAPIGQAP